MLFRSQTADGGLLSDALRHLAYLIWRPVLLSLAQVPLGSVRVSGSPLTLFASLSVYLHGMVQDWQTSASWALPGRLAPLAGPYVQDVPTQPKALWVRG